jgi:hypothetical protein
MSTPTLSPVADKKVLPVRPNKLTRDKVSPAQRVAEPCKKLRLENPFFLISSVTSTTSFGGVIATPRFAIAPCLMQFQECSSERVSRPESVDCKATNRVQRD